MVLMLIFAFTFTPGYIATGNPVSFLQDVPHPLLRIQNIPACLTETVFIVKGMTTRQVLAEMQQYMTSCRDPFHSLIITRLILNLVMAERAWGTPAGKMIVSPVFIRYV